MARAKRIWVVMTWQGDFQAFTVKKELIAWMRECPDPIEWILRLPDGGPKGSDDGKYIDLLSL